jgi:plasminogen activator inhibitor 1 RNA-binding protein
MNRFAALDSDNEDDTPKTAAVADKKKAAAAKTDAAPAKAATAPKSSESAPAAPKKGISSIVLSFKLVCNVRIFFAAAEGKGKTENTNKKAPAANGAKSATPGQKSERKPKSAPSGEVVVSSSGGDEVEAAGAKGDFTGTKRDSHAHGKVPRSRYEKRQDENDPKIKPDNRIRGAAHTNTKRRPSKNADKQEVEGLAKEGEKHPENLEVPVEPVTEDGGEEQAPEEPAEPAEPEPVTLTLEEYQRRKEEERAKSAILGVAKATRPVEEITGLKIKEGDGLENGVYTGSAKASKGSKSSQRSTGKTLLTDLGFKLESDEPRNREERRPPSGGKPGGRGSGGRSGGGRGYAPRGPRVDLADASAFPSL